eukprot:757431-Hanusia_phi.AAC.2
MQACTLFRPISLALCVLAIPMGTSSVKKTSAAVFAQSMYQHSIRGMAARSLVLRGGRDTKEKSSSEEEDPSFRMSQDDMMQESTDADSDVELPSETEESSSVFDEAKAKEEEKYLPIELPPKAQDDYRKRLGLKYGRRRKEVVREGDVMLLE